MATDRHTDVVVLGGGAAGVAAAVAAAGKGAKVILIERNAYLGGKATAAQVGTVCGLYKFNTTTSSEYIVKGFAKEFAEALKEISGTSPLHNAEGLHYLPYDIDAFKNLCLQLLMENKVEILLNTLVSDAVIENSAVQAVKTTTANRDTQIQLQSIIDCSGSSIISQLVNLPLITSEQYQAAAQVFTLQGVAESNEARLGMILMKALRNAIDENKLPGFYDRVYIVQGSLKNNFVSLKLGIPVPVTHSPKNLQELKKSAKDFIKNLTAFLITAVPCFKNASISNIAPEVGTRVGMRTMGRYTLTEQDVLQCKKFDDAIANGSWPIEEWEQHKKVKMRYFNTGDFYQIPAGCLQSNSIKNLFMAGANIAATSAAIASARVMGTCLQTGYAAGYLAAAAADGMPQIEAIQNIQHHQL
jgi:NAD(P)-dependent dehydrogenase (short-subunit alcohol dehydrogenase family)